MTGVLETIRGCEQAAALVYGSKLARSSRSIGYYIGCLWNRNLGDELVYRGIKIGFRRDGQDAELILNVGARLLRLLNADGWTVSYIPFCRSDLPDMEEAARRAGLSIPPRQRRQLTAGEAVAAVERQDVVPPAVLLEYDSKTTDFMASIGRSTWTFRTDRLSVDELQFALTTLHDNLGEHQSALERGVHSMRQQLLGAEDSVRELLRR